MKRESCVMYISVKGDSYSLKRVRKALTHPRMRMRTHYGGNIMNNIILVEENPQDSEDFYADTVYSDYLIGYDEDLDCEPASAKGYSWEEWIEVEARELELEEELTIGESFADRDKRVLEFIKNDLSNHRSFIYLEDM
jgi:hypothetical protein